MRKEYTGVFETDEPNRAQIIRSKEGWQAAPLEEYRFPEEGGSFTGTLVYRCWHRNKPMLLCYFDTDDGRKMKLAAWWQSWGVSYSPSETHISFTDVVMNGSRWKCTYCKKENGYIRWQRADPLD